jgi:hypothetical protein
MPRHIGGSRQARKCHCSGVLGLRKIRWLERERAKVKMAWLGPSCVSCFVLYGLKLCLTRTTSFTVWMVFGAVITKACVPNPSDIWGRPRSLEDLGQGKAHLKQLEKDELDDWKAFVSGNTRRVS